MSAPLPAVQHSPASRSDRTERAINGFGNARLLSVKYAIEGVLGEGGVCIVPRATHMCLHESSTQRTPLQNIVPTANEYASCAIPQALSKRAPAALTASAQGIGGKLGVVNRPEQSGSRDPWDPNRFGGHSGAQA
ncbi:MAG: hypothetical protein ABI488_16975 [Polyangiaceae bacterium]